MMKKDMLVAVCTDIGKISYERRPVPVPADEEVLIHMEYIGICGSDKHFYEKGFPLENLFPKVLGHECAGVITAIGKNVKRLRVGDRVCIEPGIPCGKCELCRKGLYNLCEKVKFLSAYHEDGCMSEYISYPEQYCYVLPETMNTMEGALMEPFSVGLHAVARSGAEAGDSVLVYGSGTIGIMVIYALQAAGVSKIFCIDRNKDRLSIADSLGAETFLPGQTDDIPEALYNVGIDIAFDCTGSEECIYQLPSIVKRGGTVVIVGNLGRTGKFDYFNFYEKELSVLGVFRYRFTFPKALKLMEVKKIDFSPLISAIYPLNETDLAFAQLCESSKGVKTIIRVP